MVQKFDAITLEILWRRIISIVDEADASVARTAFSSLLRDAHDYTCIFSDKKGRLLAQGTFCTPGQAGAMALGIKTWINMLSGKNHEPGDIYITNDPWLLAGHLNDICVMCPIFFNNKVVGFTACVFHHSDIGGRVSSDNHDVFEDGLFIPPLKLYDAGVLNESIINLIRWNVRTPEDVIGDIRSQVAANYICSEKVREMMSDVGLNNLDDIADQIINVTEKSMRDAISEIPDGIYPYEGIIEGPGGRQDIKIKISVEIKGSDALVDLDGSSPEVNWGGNVVYNFTYAYILMAIKGAFNPDVPTNEGCIRPVKIKATEGTVINCKFPASVAARLQIGHFMTEMVFKALASAAPEKIIAASGGTPAWMQVLYGKRHNGSKFYSVSIRGGGMGAGKSQDGRSCVIFPANGANTPCEIFESDCPLIMEKRELLCDSGGPGKMRGGLGELTVYKVPDDELSPSTRTMIGIQGGRFRYPADGLFGGKPGAKSKFQINDIDQDASALNYANPGDEIIFCNPGGGGYENPLDRDQKLVEDDVKNGYVSIQKAREDYGVIINMDTMKIDIEKTQNLRASMKEELKGAPLMHK